MRIALIFAQIDTSPLPRATGDPIKTALSVVFGIVGAIALLMIVLGGFRYITAHGDSNQVAQARNTILYALIGLLVSMAAFSIVTFVAGRIG